MNKTTKSVNATINSRIKKIRSHFCEGSNAKFAEIMKKQPNTTSNWVRDGYNVGRGVATEIAEIFSINLGWLLAGEGEMLSKPKAPLEKVDTKEPIETAYVKLLPIFAKGGSLNDFSVSVKDSDCEKIISPIKGADWAITVSGDSMAPEYPSGSKILIKRINEQSFIEWGRCYVLDTCNGTVVKKLIAPDVKDKDFGFDYITCVSVNHDPIYKAFKVPTRDIYAVYRVLLLLTEK